MAYAEQLEALWTKLRRQIDECQAISEALALELEAKRQTLRILDNARTAILQGVDTSDVIARAALAQLQVTPDVRSDSPPTTHEAVLRYVYASKNEEGVSAGEVAKALRLQGYGTHLKWRNFYNYVTVSLNRWSERGALHVGVLLGLARGSRRFHMPPRGDRPSLVPTASRMDDKRVAPRKAQTNSVSAAQRMGRAKNVPTDTGPMPGVSAPSSVSPSDAGRAPNRGVRAPIRRKS